MKERINLQRLQEELEELSSIGRATDTGIHRRALTDADMEARKWLCAKIEAAGLELHIDQAANIFGRLNWPGDGPSVISGSHLDTVPGAGHLDGALGVVAALECLRRLKELGFQGQRPLEMADFTDEEGRFGGMPGSQAVAGLLSPEQVFKSQDLDGVLLADALESRGFDAQAVLRAARPSGSIAAYVELHIEQGPVLEADSVQVGVVTGIVGLFRWKVRLVGMANHAGTTPMNMRRDPFRGLAEFAGRIDELLAKHGGPQSVATIGRVELVPGAANVVPGVAEFILESRDVDTEVLRAVQVAFREELSRLARERELMFEYEVLSEIEPVRCDPKVMSSIEQACAELDVSRKQMPSGAAHDAQQMASIAPTGMIFIPSVGGRSHSPAEWSSWQDIETGANVLLQTLHHLAS